jgi:hypothetical protein
MLRRTKGRLLLTLLVITGLAGTINDTSLSKKERKLAIGLMKDTKADVFKNVKGLTAEQLNFKPTQDSWSVKQCIYQITISQNKLWYLLQSSMKKPANPEQRSEIKMTDEELITMMGSVSNKADFGKIVEPRKSSWKTTDAALSVFKNENSAHIRYINSSTEDLRNHVIQMPFGWIDCYQLSLAIAAYNNGLSKRISEIKNHPQFPK